MPLRIATFNAENLMNRFDFSGFRNQLRRDRALQVLEVKDKAHYEMLEQARVVAHTDDAMQLTALAIADTRADILCLQEVENLEALKSFEYGYLFKMIGRGYRHKYLIEGNDTRGIDVAVMMRDETYTGEEIEFLDMRSYAHLTYRDFDLFNDSLAEIGLEKGDKIFRRDCLELDVKIGGKPVTLFVVHFKSMGASREDVDGREWTMPIRTAEAFAVRRIVEEKFGVGKTAGKRWMICGDLNDYRTRIVVSGSRHGGYDFDLANEANCGFDPLVEDGFAVDLSERLEPMDRWTLFHSRGPLERHLCQLDYVLTSPALAESNPKSRPEILHYGQPWRTPFPPDQEVSRYPRTGWDRPKASDHSPVTVELSIR